VEQFALRSEHHDRVAARIGADCRQFLGARPVDGKCHAQGLAGGIHNNLECRLRGIKRMTPEM
jgi:hypothetical protein